MTDRKAPEQERTGRWDTRRSGQTRLSVAEVAQGARRQLAEITGLRPEGVTSLEQGDDGRWKVTVELLELSRIPKTDDVLGTYQASIETSGEVIAYRRVRRYARGRSLQEQGSW